jgi:hypothetical protein
MAEVAGRDRRWRVHIGELMTVREHIMRLCTLVDAHPEIAKLTMKFRDKAGKVSHVGSIACDADAGTALLVEGVPKWNTIREQMAAGARAAPPGASWLSRLVWALIDIDQTGLVEADRDIAAIVWPNNWPTGPDNPTGMSHTISYMLGQEEMTGSVTATAICDALAPFLGPNHCELALNAKE